MRLFLYIVAMVTMVSFTPPAHATDRVACSTRSVLEVVIEQGVPIDDLGNPIVDCTLLPESFVNNELLRAERAVIIGHSMACGGPNEYCVIWIIRATYEGITFYYEVGLYEAIPVDAFEESVAGVADLGGPFLPYGIPGGRHLPIDAPTQLAETDAVVVR